MINFVLELVHNSKMPEVKLIVARHGNTFNKGDVILRVGARTDIPLTEEGKAQGLRLGENLLTSGLKPTRFLAAPLKRTIQTCEEAAKAFGDSIHPELLPFLTELDYGEYDGRPETEVIQKLGALEAKAQGKHTDNSQDFISLGNEALTRWDKEKILPAAWSFLQPRVNELENQWISLAQQLQNSTTNEIWLAVTSNGIARFALAILPSKAIVPESLKLSTGAYGVFEWDGSVWNLENWNIR